MVTVYSVTPTHHLARAPTKYATKQLCHSADAMLACQPHSVQVWNNIYYLNIIKNN